MEELPWLGGADEFRSVQALAKSGQWAEALQRARRLLTEGNLGRKNAARLHSLICWVYTDGLHQTCPAAVLHGEEALRIAGLLGEDWVRCEALQRLVRAYAHLAEFDRAREALAELSAEVEANPSALEGGAVALGLLRSYLATAEGNVEAALAAVAEAVQAAPSAAPLLLAEIRVAQVQLLLGAGRRQEATAMLAELALASQDPGEQGLTWEFAAAWAALAGAGPAVGRPLLERVRERAQVLGCEPLAARCLALEAKSLATCDRAQAFHRAQEALCRAARAGRMDLVRQFQRSLATLLA